MKITIYDVAKEANVSIATVSKVINKNGRISEKKKSV
jgi:LacI family transcriptional regulator